jgi:chromosome segregation ATPase
MRKIICLTLAICAASAIAYTQSDLLNAQTNYQAAKTNLDKTQTALTKANTDLSKAESAVQIATKKLADAQAMLKSKQESEVVAKRNLDTAKVTHDEAGLTVDNIWKQLNGAPQQPTNP